MARGMVTWQLLAAILAVVVLVIVTWAVVKSGQSGESFQEAIFCMLRGC